MVRYTALTGNSTNMVALRNEQATPASNTGYDSQNRNPADASKWSVGLDWLDFTFRNLVGRHEAEELIREYEHVSGRNIQFCPTRAAFNGCQWDGSGAGSDGSLVWFRAASVDETGTLKPAVLKIALPGTALAQIDTEDLGRWLNGAAEGRDLDCTRIDIALDDHDKVIKLRKIAEARLAGNFFNCSYSEIITSCRRGEIEGTTIYFGSRSSDKRLRVYDKTIESKEKILGNRWEAQFRRKTAYEVFSLWLSTVEKGKEPTARLLQNIVVGVVDFRERDNDSKDRNRCPRLPWFGDMLAYLGANPARISITKIEQTAQRSINWIKRSVGSTLAGLQIILRDEFQPFLQEVISSGATRLTNARRATIYDTDVEQLLY